MCREPGGRSPGWLSWFSVGSAGDGGACAEQRPALGRSRDLQITHRMGLVVEGCQAGSSFGFIPIVPARQAVLNACHTCTALPMPWSTGADHKKPMSGDQKSPPSWASGRKETQGPSALGSQQCQGPQHWGTEGCSLPCPQQDSAMSCLSSAFPPATYVYSSLSLRASAHSVSSSSSLGLSIG